MAGRPVFLTKEGRLKIESELKVLREVRRPEVSEMLRVAKDFSDTAENAEFEEAKNEQAKVEGRILELETMLANATLIDEEHRSLDVVKLGSRVELESEEGTRVQYTIVGSAEAHAKDGKISNESPVGRAVLGRSVGSTVEVNAPAGVIRFRIISVE